MFTGVLGDMPTPEQLQHLGTGSHAQHSPLLQDTHGQDTFKISVPGMASVPAKISKRIINGEFVDMAELLPDSWQVEDDHSSPTSRKASRRPPVTDITIWSECFATFAAIATMKYPEKGPHLFAYMRTIAKASRNFEGTTWVAYDTAFRRQAANLGTWDWGAIDTGLYNEAFAGRARVLPRCSRCLAENHDERSCPLTPAPKPQPPTGGQVGPTAKHTSVDLCGLFNKATGNECRFRECKYAHICALCKSGPHPASSCSRPRRTLLPGKPTGH